MATYGVAVSRTEYIQGQCYSSWPCGHISATILCVVACGVITFRCAEASLKRQHLHATWKRRATKRMHARTYTSCARACVECGKYKKKGESEREREKGEKKKSTRLPRFEDRGRQWLPVSSLRGVQLSVWTMVARMNRRPPTPLCPFSSFALRQLLPAMTSSPTDPSSF